VVRGNGSKDQSADLAKLRAEAESLRQQTNDFAVLREANRRSQQRPEAKPKTPLQMTVTKRAKMIFGHRWVAAFRDYAEKNGTNSQPASSKLLPLFQPKTKRKPI
jgi:DNA-nicking Smr family endonuclease